jgi:class 3 adenylate cyclase/CHASE2 domain-containing sensor protein
MPQQLSKQLSKYFRKTTHLVTSPFTIGLVITIGVAAMSVDYYNNRSLAINDKDEQGFRWLVSTIHQKTIDLRLRARGPAQGSDRVAVIAVDEKAVQQEGRWPWPRDKQAEVIKRVLDAGAKSVAFDITYSEADETSAIPTLHKLKRDLSRNEKVSSEAIPLIDKELEKVDGDQVFANMVKKYADHLIMGSFYGDEAHFKSYQDSCLDTLFDRTAEAKYWRHETSPLLVEDKTLQKDRLPIYFKQALQDYILPIEVDAANKWFKTHKEMAGKITSELEDLGISLPPENYAGLSTLWLNHDLENGKLLLEQVSPALANNTGVERFYSQFGRAFTKPDTVSLRRDVRFDTDEYCSRFFTEHDELLSFNLYKGKWGDNLETFNEQSWEKAWKSAQPNTLEARTPATSEKPEPKSVADVINQLKSHSFINTVLDIDQWDVNIPLIGDVTKHTGYFNAMLDSDGTIRRSPLFVRRGNSYMPSIAFKQFLLDHDYKAKIVIDAENIPRPQGARKIVKDLEILDNQDKTVMHIPVDENGRLMINYSGAEQMFPHVSAAEILSDSPTMTIDLRIFNPQTGTWDQKPKHDVDKKAFFKDKLLVIGATATGIYDLRVSPFQENYPGVETHANVLSNLTVEQARTTGGRAPASAPGFLRTHPLEERSMWIIILALGVSLSALLTYYGSVAGLGITGAALAGIYLVDRYYFFANGIVTTVIFPVSEVVMSYVTLTFYKYFTEERKKRELKGTFEKYVSPAIVAEVLSDPENIELGGKKMELTVMFSDVRGFTTISEKLDPRQLSDLLNSYLTPMTDLVFKNKGTLDKYMGDAIMAFWGAPIHFEDHAQHAARCALQMIEKLKLLQAEYRAKGFPEIDIGIGLNTGEMSVGNMGSETVRSYTVMGDSVNLGSRLEGINKEYHTHIIISEFTQRALKDKFVTREVDWVRVKGKAQPVRIFELIAEGSVPEEKAKLLETFQQGFQLYHERNFNQAIEKFKACLEVDPKDGVSQLYLERCEDYQNNPPGENWDGVCTMTHK